MFLIKTADALFFFFFRNCPKVAEVWLIHLCSDLGLLSSTEWWRPSAPPSSLCLTRLRQLSKDPIKAKGHDSNPGDWSCHHYFLNFLTMLPLTVSQLLWV